MWLRNVCFVNSNLLATMMSRYVLEIMSVENKSGFFLATSLVVLNILPSPTYLLYYLLDKYIDKTMICLDLTTCNCF